MDFRNAVIVMTSNIGSSVIQERIGKADYEEIKSEVMDLLTGHFRPEFINRVDEVVMFRPLSREQLRAICEIQVGYLDRRLRDRDMAIEFTDAALDLIGEAGFDPVYGARPLKRVIQQRVENRLAQEILQGHYGPGDLIRVDVRDGNIVFEKDRKREVA